VAPEKVRFLSYARRVDVRDRGVGLDVRVIGRMVVVDARGPADHPHGDEMMLCTPSPAAHPSCFGVH
jgi:hypothetical protein